MSMSQHQASCLGSVPCFTTSEADRYFRELLPEIDRAIINHLWRVSLLKGSGRSTLSPSIAAANDNAGPAGKTTSTRHASAPSAISAAEIERRDHAGEVRRLRTASSSEVRSMLVRDTEVQANIRGSVYQDYLHSVMTGRFRGPQDRALLFEIVRCRSIKEVRARAKVLLKTVMPIEGQDPLDRVASRHQTDEEEYDRARALKHVRALLNNLGDDDRELIEAKLDGTLIALARRRNKCPETIRSSAMRLLGRLVKSTHSHLQIILES